MHLGVKVEKKFAESAKRLIIDNGLLDKKFEIFHDADFVIFPISKKPSKALLEKFGKLGCTAGKFGLKERPHVKTFEELLEGILTKEEQGDQILAYDLLGDIAILEIREELLPKKVEIAKALLESNPMIETVFRKKSAMKGEFRVRDLEFLAGKKNLIATYRESGATLKFDVSKSYFSPRLSFDRLRIAKLVKPGEKILALFAGVGPFPIVIARKHKNVEIIAMELNPDAVRDMIQNLKLNKVEKQVTAIGADVRTELKKKKYFSWANRVLMPLPHTSEMFLDSVLPCIAPGGVVHFYAFSSKNNLFEDVLEKIEGACRLAGKKCEIVNKRVVRPYAPYVVQVVIDFRVS